MKHSMTMLAAALLLVAAMQTATAAAPAPGPDAGPSAYPAEGKAAVNDANVTEDEKKGVDVWGYSVEDEDQYKAYPDEELDEDAPVDVRDCWSCN